MLNIDLISLVSTGLAFFIVAISPGPATISNATIAMNHGRKVSFVYGAGLSFGLVLWGVVAATGMGAVLQGSLYLLTVLKILGGMYLLWLAIQTARSAWTPDNKFVTVSGGKRWFLRGLLLNTSNPKSVIAYMAALSIGLGTNAGNSSLVAATLVCMVMGFVANGLYSFLFSMKGMMFGYQRVRRKVDGVVAVLFSIAGIGMIRSAFTD